MREQKGAWVRALERFNIVVTKAAANKSAAQLLGTSMFGGDSMKNHGNKQSQLDSVVKSCCGGYVTVISRDILVNCMELRWRQPCSDSVAPCLCKVERVVVKDPLSRVGHTQVAAFGAFFKNRWQAW